MSFFEFMPLGKYPSVGDSEKIPTEEIQPSNPAFLKNPAGVSDNHSSTELSIPAPSNGASQEASGSQYNDDELDNPSQGHLDPQGYDVNMSGPHPTQGIEERYASVASDCAENSDYMDFTFDTSNVAESRLGHPIRSWQEAREYPVPPKHDFTPEQEYEFGNDSVTPQGEFGSPPSYIAGIYVCPIVRRP